MAKSPKVLLKEKRVGNVVVELFYVETDETGAYVIKETIDQNGNTKEKRRDVILNFPIELLGMKRINGFDAPYGKLVYRINIAGKEYINSLKQIRLLIRKKVGKQPFHSKYGPGLFRELLPLRIHHRSGVYKGPCPPRMLWRRYG